MAASEATTTSHAALTRWATEQDWAENQELIGNLYAVAPLRKVMAFVEETHGIKATYISQFNAVCHADPDAILMIEKRCTKRASRSGVSIRRAKKRR